jgi:hypothetical protein
MHGINNSDDGCGTERWEWNGCSEIFNVKMSEHTVLHRDHFVKFLDQSLILVTQSLSKYFVFDTAIM